MSKEAVLHISIIFLTYVVFSQFLIKGYNNKIDLMFKTNSDILRSCSNLSEGEDLY